MEDSDKGHTRDSYRTNRPQNKPGDASIVLEKSIFSNIFDKDIKRIYFYKKSERLARAIHLIGPAFASSPALRDRLDRIAMALVDGALLPPATARPLLSKELLTLSSILSIARTGGLLSSMNADLIAGEAEQLLEEIASYEEPRLFLDDMPTIAALSTRLSGAGSRASERSLGMASGAPGVPKAVRQPSAAEAAEGAPSKGQIKDNTSERAALVLKLVQEKGPVYIKDISTLIRDVSEKTIQRELQSLIDKGFVRREGQRRWSTYRALV